MNFKISVLIPVYNASRYLEDAVQSALLQEETDEVVLCEDYSTDNSFDVCKELTQKFNKVKLYRHQDGKNHGAGPTRNLAIEKSKNEYIAFLDADDYFLPGRFNKTKHIFENYPDCDGVYECVGTKFESEDLKTKWIKRGRSINTTINQIVPPQKLFQSLILSNIGYFHLDGFCFKKNIINKYPNLNFESLELSQDILFGYKIAACSLLYPGQIANPVAVRRIHEDNRHTKSNLKALYFTLNFYNYLLEWLKENQIQKNTHKYLQNKIYSTNLDYIALKYSDKGRSRALLKYLLTQCQKKEFFFSKYLIKNLFMVLKLYQPKKI